MNRYAFLIVFGMTMLSSCSEESTRIEITYNDEQLRFIQCPLGGIGTGNMLLNGYGAVSELEIFNRASMDELPPEMTFFSLWTRSADGEPVTRILEREYLDEYPNPFGKPRQQLGGIPRFSNALMTNAYPVVRYELSDDEVPLKATLLAWSPYIPVDPQSSSIPAAILEWAFHNPTKDTVEFSLAFSMANPFGGITTGGQRSARTGQNSGPVTAPYFTDRLRGLYFSAPKQDSLLPGAGTFTVATPSPVTLSTPLYRGGWWDNAHLFWDDFSSDGMLEARTDTVEATNGRADAGALCSKGVLAPGERATIPMIFSWYIPYRTLEESHALGNPDVRGANMKNYYATRFSGVEELTAYLSDHMGSLREKTFAFSDAMVNSSIPPAVLDAAISNLASLKTNLLLQDAQGNVHGFEGLGNDFGCCPGNCTHVWNYAQTMAAVFPSLERNVRNTGFTNATHWNGYQCFRTVFPLGDHWFKNVAADGQMGNIMRVYREWKMSGDNAWLGTIWPQVKDALEFAWKGPGELPRGFEWMRNCPVPWDPDKEGVLRGDQHNTYDINFFGPNMMTGSLYLGALKAVSEMAMVMNEPQKAEEYKDLYLRGREKYMELLWNGSYFVQQVEVIDGVTIPERLQSPPDEQGNVIPKYQYGNGCLSDQLLGQYLAFVSGMGYILDTSVVRTTLKSIYENNFRPEMREFENVQRIYAANGEPGLVICSWPDGDKPVLPFVYADEVWTGIEYQVAASCIFTGLVEEGLTIAEGVRSRYTGNNRNPFAEIESGRYYARAMSSWAVYQAMAGYRWDGIKKVMQFKPAEDVLPIRFFWSTSEGWGTINVSRAGIELKCQHGNLELERLDLAGKSFFVFREFIPSQPVSLSYHDQVLMLDFPEGIKLMEGEAFRMEIP